MMDLNTETCSRTTSNKRRFVTKPGRKDGLTLKIHHTLSNKSKPNVIRFLHASFNWTSNALAVSNHSGDVYIIDFTIGKFWYLDTISSISIVKFLPKTEKEFIVGEYGGTLNVLNSESGLTGLTMKGHSCAVTDISFSNNDKCITTSCIDAIIWDLKTFRMIQVLQPEGGDTIKQAMFMPVSNNILACFQDDIIQIWKADTFEPIKQILPSATNKVQIKSIAFTQNGQAMIMGGHSCNLIVFIIEIWAVVQTIALPSNILGIKKLEFISRPFDSGANKILVILSSNGHLLFYDVEAEAVISRLSSNNEILKVSICQQGKQMACVLNTGEICLYNLAPYMSVPVKAKEKIVFVNKPVKKFDCNKKQVNEVLDLNKLKAILREFGEYPDLYRVTIWTSILSLPNDKEQYNTVMAQTYDSPFNNLEEIYPMGNKQDLQKLKRALKNIVSWCPFFAEVTYLPIFIFPFVRIFQNEPILTFEALIIIIVNYCQYWFEYHPLPPINILGIIENVLIEHDPILTTHFHTMNTGSVVYAWPLLQSVFSEVLTSPEWLILWDHILSNEPSFLLMAAVAYNIVSRHVLLTFKKKEQIEVYFHSQNTIDFKRFINKIYNLLEDTGITHHPRQYLDMFKKPKKGIYPKFDDLPRVRLEYKEKLSDLQKESQHLARESDILNERNVELERLKSAERENEELLRLSELQKVYQDKINDEHRHVLEQKNRLQMLYTKLKSDESNVLKLSNSSVKRDDVKIKMVHENKMSTGEEVKKIEQELLEHYSVLLKHKLQIEKLTGGNVNVDYTQLKDDYTALTKEIEKARKVANDREYLKKLNISTSLDAVDKLIDQVESQLKMEANGATGIASSEGKMNILMLETKELSDDLSKLIDLITKMKGNID